MINKNPLNAGPATKKEIIACYRFFGFTDKEIAEEMKKIISRGGRNVPIEYIETLDYLMDTKDDTCPDCEGCGQVAGAYFSEDGITTCDRCNGKGLI